MHDPDVLPIAPDGHPRRTAFRLAIRLARRRLLRAWWRLQVRWCDFWYSW